MKSELINRSRAILPGLLIMMVVATVSHVINMAVPLLSGMLIAIIIGMILRNTGLVRPSFEAGFAFSGKTVLRLGVVLLGFRLALPDVIDLGIGPIVAITGTVVSVYFVTLFIGRRMRTPHSVRVLTATGTAICGAAAVAGMSSVVRPDPRWADHDEEVGVASATAIASVTLYGTATMLLIPALASVFGLTPTQTGVWIGTSVHEVGQVVASAGFTHSDTILDVATVTKLGRVVLLAPLVAFVGYLETYREKTIVSMGRARALAEGRIEGDYFPDLSQKRGSSMTIPAFVVGFLATMMIRSIAGWLGWAEFLSPTFHVLNTAASILLIIAMGAMGAGVHLKTLLTRGGRGLVLGFIAMLVATLVSFALVIAFV
ncbi:MAG: putative sulfate exporter family transporter [Actinomycetaceae bacterium]|nr:putative sulfate exporter family transporter [Actinomycetaceae bacterium]